MKNISKRNLFAVVAQFRNSAGAMKMKVVEEKRNPFKNKGVTKILVEEEVDYFSPSELVPEDERTWWDNIFDSKEEAEAWLKEQESIKLKGE
jgi:hypothetical protein